MRTRLYVWVLAAVAAAASAGPASAQFITMRFGTGGLPAAVPGSLVLTGAPGGTVAVQVFLTDSDTTLRTQNGLRGAGVGVQTANSAVANVLTTSDVAANPEFQGFAPVINATPAAGNASVQNTAFPTPVQMHQQGTTPTAAAPDYVLVGTFTFHIPAGTTTGTTLSLFDWQGGSSVNNQSGTGTNLDTQPGMFADTMAIAVPEPSGLALAGLAAAGLFARRRRPAAPAAA